MDTVERAVQAVNRLPDRLVLLGFHAESAERDYGWIVRGPELLELAGERVWSVGAFIEKPSADQTDAALASEALWNTLVVAAKAEVLWALGWRCLSEIMAPFELLGSVAWTSAETGFLATIYDSMRPRNLSADLLQRVPERTAVMELSGVLWSDWGRADRVVRSLQRIGKQPGFATARPPAASAAAGSP